MKNVGKELFLINLLYAIPKGKLVYKKEFDDIGFHEAPIGDVINSFYTKQPDGSKPINLNSLMLRFFCPPSTPVKYMRQVMMKHIEYYFNKYYSAEPIYINDLVLSAEYGVLAIVDTKNWTSSWKQKAHIKTILGDGMLEKEENLIKISI